jgi:hypothetical protein
MSQAHAHIGFIYAHDDDDGGIDGEVLHGTLPEESKSSLEDRRQLTKRTGTKEFLRDNSEDDVNTGDHYYKQRAVTPPPPPIPLPGQTDPPITIVGSPNVDSHGRNHIHEMLRTDTIEKILPPQVKKKPTNQPSTILINEPVAVGGGSRAPQAINFPASSPLVQTGPLNSLNPSSTSNIVNNAALYEKFPYLLWRGGHVWKIPFNGRGSPEHRVVIIKRAAFPGVYSRRISVVDRHGQLMPSDMGTFIAYPPTLLWYPGDTKLESLYSVKNVSITNNARELILYEGAKLTEGHNTSAFWKLAARNKPTPKPEYCFSVITSTRSLDMAAESVTDAQDWKMAFKLLLESFVDSSVVEINMKGIREWGQPSLPVEPALNININSQLPIPPNKQLNRQRLSGDDHLDDNGPKLPPPQQYTTTHVKASVQDTVKNKKEHLKRKLFEAAHGNDLETLKLVLQQGVPVNLMETGTHDTVLMIACRNGHAQMVKVCLQHGAKNDPHPDFGLTALHVCVEANQLAACMALLNAAAAQNHADVIITNLTDPHGQTVLHIASANGQGDNNAIVETLLRHGADPNRMDDMGLTPVHIMAGMSRSICRDGRANWYSTGRRYG